MYELKVTCKSGGGRREKVNDRVCKSCQKEVCCDKSIDDVLGVTSTKEQ